MAEPAQIALTLDTDWAPDAAIRLAADLLRAADVRATWFVTHASPAIDELRRDPELFEVGIHPNFMAGSSHGADPASVLAHCMALVPEARSVRMHGLLQSTALLEQTFFTTPIVTDASLLLHRVAGLRAFAYHWRGRRFVRVPTFWEDDVEMERLAPDFSRDSMLSLLAGGGLKVFCFHPVHVLLNSKNMDAYRHLKTAAGNLRDVSPTMAASHAHQGEGTRTVFEELIAKLASGGRGQRICDIAAAACEAS